MYIFFNMYRKDLSKLTKNYLNYIHPKNCHVALRNSLIGCISEIILIMDHRSGTIVKIRILDKLPRSATLAFCKKVLIRKKWFVSFEQFFKLRVHHMRKKLQKIVKKQLFVDFLKLFLKFTVDGNFNTWNSNCSIQIRLYYNP
jgi:hypothetical protein